MLRPDQVLVDLAHRRYYYPGMTTTGTLPVKTFDSAHDGRATRSRPTGFATPASALDAPPGESIESRVPVFF